MPNAQDGKCAKPKPTPEPHRDKEQPAAQQDLTLSGPMVAAEVKPATSSPVATAAAHEALDDLCGSRVSPDVKKAWRIFDPKPSLGTIIRRVIMAALMALFAYLLVRWAQLEPEVDEFLKQVLPWLRGTFVPWWKANVWPWIEPVWTFFFGAS